MTKTLTLFCIVWLGLINLSLAADSSLNTAKIEDLTQCCSLKHVRPEPVEGRMGFDKLSPNVLKRTVLRPDPDVS